jgi:hypothetical protein
VAEIKNDVIGILAELKPLILEEIRFLKEKIEETIQNKKIIQTSD